MDNVKVPCLVSSIRLFPQSVLLTAGTAWVPEVQGPQAGLHLPGGLQAQDASALRQVCCGTLLHLSWFPADSSCPARPPSRIAWLWLDTAQMSRLAFTQQLCTKTIACTGRSGTTGGWRTPGAPCGGRGDMSDYFEDLGTVGWGLMLARLSVQHNYYVCTPLCLMFKL